VLRHSSLLAALTLISVPLVVVKASELSYATSKLPDVAAPPGGHSEWIARSMRLNGLPMTIKSFRSSLAPDEVDHYYERWAETLGGARTSRSRDGEWSLLAILSSASYITVRVRVNGFGTEGLIAVSPPPESVVAITESAFPHPAEAEIVNLQEYDDDGIEAEHIGMMSQQSVVVSAASFRNLFERHGWTVVRDESTMQIRGGRVVEAQKGQQVALVTLQPEPQSTRTAIVAVWRK
jgi:hypothetical protein